jgi:hypothetical protein
LRGRQQRSEVATPEEVLNHCSSRNCSSRSLFASPSREEIPHSPCSARGLDTIRRAGWLLVVGNRWLDRLKILSWHASLAAQKDIKSVGCRDHLKRLIAHWLTQASLRLPPSESAPMPMGSDPSLADFDLGPLAVGRLLGELAVHRESFSQVWSGSPESLECILGAILKI